MACTEAYNKLWTHAIEKERAIQARQRKDYLKMLQEEAQGSRAPRKRIPGQRELAPGGGSPTGRNLGKSSSMPSLHGSRPASSAGVFQPPIPGASLESTLSHTKPNNMVPVLDGTISPKPMPGNRGLPSGYIAAVGTNMGVLMWPGSVSHKRSRRPRTGAGAPADAPPEASPASPVRAPSAPATPGPADEGNLQEFASSRPAKPLVRRSMATSMGKMIWPQDMYFVG